MLKRNAVILWAKRFFWKDPRRRETCSGLHSKADALGGRQTMTEETVQAGGSLQELGGGPWLILCLAASTNISDMKDAQ